MMVGEPTTRSIVIRICLAGGGGGIFLGTPRRVHGKGANYSLFDNMV